MTEIQLTEICAEFAIMLVSYGAEIYRTEDTIRRICTAYGHKNAEIYVTPANFIITVKSPDGSAHNQLEERFGQEHQP